MTDTLRYERRKFIDRDLDVSLSVHQFYRAKVQLRGRIPKLYFLLLVEKKLKSFTEDDEPEEKVECWRNLDYNYSQNLTVCPEGTCLSKIGIHNQPLWHECWHTNQTSDLIDTGFCPCSFAEKSSTKCNLEAFSSFLIPQPLHSSSEGRSVNSPVCGFDGTVCNDAGIPRVVFIALLLMIPFFLFLYLCYKVRISDFYIKYLNLRFSS